MKALASVLTFIGGIAVGAAVGVLMAPEKGAETRRKILEVLKEKGVILSKDQLDELVAKVKAKIGGCKCISEVRDAVDELL